jgi:hypothetical protein
MGAGVNGERRQAPLAGNVRVITGMTHRRQGVLGQVSPRQFTVRLHDADVVPVRPLLRLGRFVPL